MILCSYRKQMTFLHHKATQTDNADMYSLLSDGLESLHEMNRYDDFVSVLKCICDGIMTDNIVFQLLMDFKCYARSFGVNVEYKTFFVI
jgi:hypothetical protein